MSEYSIYDFSTSFGVVDETTRGWVEIVVDAGTSPIAILRGCDCMHAMSDQFTNAYLINTYLYSSYSMIFPAIKIKNPTGFTVYNFLKGVWESQPSGR